MATIAEAQAQAEAARQDITEARGSIAGETASIASARATLSQQQKSLEQARVIPKAQLYRQRGIAAVQARRDREAAIQKSMRDVSASGTSIKEHEAKVAEYETSVGVSETEVAAYEQEIATAQAAQIQYEKELADYNIQKAAAEATYEKELADYNIQKAAYDQEASTAQVAYDKQVSGYETALKRQADAKEDYETDKDAYHLAKRLYGQGVTSHVDVPMDYRNRGRVKHFLKKIIKDVHKSEETYEAQMKKYEKEMKETSVVPVAAVAAAGGYTPISFEDGKATLGEPVPFAPPKKLDLTGLNLTPTTSITGKQETISGYVPPAPAAPKPSIIKKILSTGLVGIPGSQLFFKSKEELKIIEEARKGGLKEFFIGETGKPFMGVGLPGQPIPVFTLEKIKKTVAEKGGFPGRVVSLGIPITPAGVAAYGAAPLIIPQLPSIIRGGISLGISGLGVKSALDPSLTPEERVFGGFLGVAGAVGAYTEFAPFVKGQLVKLKPSYKKAIITPGGKQVVPKLPKEYVEIPGMWLKEAAKEPFTVRPSMTPTMALELMPKGTGFGYTQTYQRQFIGGKGPVTTSAVDLITKKYPVKIKLGEGYGLFGTPYDPITMQPRTRISRLGLKDLFKFPKTEPRISFKSGKAQAVIFEGAKITKKGAPGTFKAMGMPGSELEVTTLSSIISGRQIAVTTVKGQPLYIYTAKLGTTATPSPLGLGKIKGLDVASYIGGAGTIAPTTLIAPSAAITSFLKSTTTIPTTTFITPTIPSRPTVPTTTFIKPTAPTKLTVPTTTFITPTIPSRPTVPTTTFIKPTTSSRYFIPRAPTYIIPTISPSRRVPPYVSPPIYPSRRVPPRRAPPIIPPTLAFRPRRRKIRRRRPTRPLFIPEVKRYGKWQPVSKPVRLRKAIGVGKERVATTLGASLRVRKAGKDGFVKLRESKRFRTSKKDPLILVEKRRFRLERRPEVKEIQIAKSKKKQEFFK